MDTRRLNTWLEISAGAYARNLAFFRRLVGPGVELEDEAVLLEVMAFDGAGSALRAR